MSSLTATSAVSRGSRSDSIGQGGVHRGGTTSTTSGALTDDGEYEEYDGDDGDDDDEEGTAMTNAEQQGHDMLSETTVKSGYLYKRGEKRKNWKKRWFVLRSAKLYYYKNEKEYQLLRFIDMAEVHTIAAVSLKKVEHCFGISTSKRQYFVRASNAKEMQAWVDALREVREQVRQRSTITRDMATLDMSGGSGTATTALGAEGATLSTPLTSSHAPPTAGTSTSTSAGVATPISIVIPGKGLYTAPAQPRMTTSGIVLSPLSTTSESDTGGPSGAEQFGLSYASSTGQSASGSPGRTSVIQHQLHPHEITSNAGGQSPASLTAHDEHGDVNTRRSRLARSSGAREASVGSSGGEGGTGNTATGGSGFSLGRRSSSQQPLSQQQQQQQQQMHVLSSSEEEGDEGDEWDEDEEADRAMPLPGPSGLGLLSTTGGMHGQTTPSSSSSNKQDTLAASSAAGEAGAPTTHVKPKVAPEFFKDSGKVIHQGYLMKQSNRRKHWRKRYFVLTSSTLSYTSSHMDAKASRQIPLSSILDAIEYTSKKTSQLTGGAPLSPSLSAFGSSSSNSLPFGRSPLLGGGGGGDSATAGVDRRGSVTQSKNSATTSATASVPADVDGGTTNPSTLSGSETENSAPTTTGERKVTVAPNQPTAASHMALERQSSTSQQTTTTTTPSGKRKKENCFKIITPKRVYIVCAPTEEEELKWLSALQALLAHYQERNDLTPQASKSTHTEPQSAATVTGKSDATPATQETQLSSSPNAQTLTASNRLNPPTLSLPRPHGRGSQDDTQDA